MIQLIGLLLPPVIDLINYFASKITDSFLSSQFRFWLSVIICSIVGIILDGLSQGGIKHVTQESVAQSILMVFGSSQLSYKAVWEKVKTRSD